MSNIIKHCGVMNNTGSRVFVFYRQLEDEPDNCLFVYRDSLPDVYADTVYRFVMSEGQRTVDLYTVAHARGLLDGKNMLTLLHNMGYLRKAKTSDITMHVTPETRIPLDVLNKEIAGVTQTQISTVKKDSPFDNFQTDVEPTHFSSAIVRQLIEQAAEHKKAYDSLIERASSLDSTVQSAFAPVQSTPESITYEDLGSGVVKLRDKFYIEVGDMSKAKMNQLISEAVKIIKERKI